MTYEQAKDKVGMCTQCYEWTSLAAPCCPAGVWFEGHIWQLDDLEDQPLEEEELDSVSRL